MRKTASTTVPVHPLLAERWSPRGFDRAHEIGDEALAALLEAARWGGLRVSYPERGGVSRHRAGATAISFCEKLSGRRSYITPYIHRMMPLGRRRGSFTVGGVWAWPGDPF